MAITLFSNLSNHRAVDILYKSIQATLPVEICLHGVFAYLDTELFLVAHGHDFNDGK